MSHPAIDPDVVDAFAPVIRRSLPVMLARRISESIRAGDYRAGDRLPSIAEMARRFRVSPPTVREAVKMLEARRLVELRQGAGVFVAARKRGPRGHAEEAHAPSA
jgi:GntR family transcriptional repressor for pyruvate dehydrogenase complex